MSVTHVAGLRFKSQAFCTKDNMNMVPVALLLGTNHKKRADRACFLQIDFKSLMAIDSIKSIVSRANDKKIMRPFFAFSLKSICMNIQIVHVYSVQVT